VSAPDDERKERVLHTRVSESLDRHLKHRARRLGMSVSTVVRHVLLNTFGLVEDIVTDTTEVALALTGAPEPPAAGARPAPTTATRDDARDGVVAWQEAILNVNAVCAHCNTILRKGVRAALGISEAAGPRVIICQRCLERVQHEPTRLPTTKERR
jgi:hypothetical protein